MNLPNVTPTKVKTLTPTDHINRCRLSNERKKLPTMFKKSLAFTFLYSFKFSVIYRWTLYPKVAAFFMNSLIMKSNSVKIILSACGVLSLGVSFAKPKLFMNRNPKLFQFDLTSFSGYFGVYNLSYHDLSHTLEFRPRQEIIGLWTQPLPP